MLGWRAVCWRAAARRGKRHGGIVGAWRALSAGCGTSSGERAALGWAARLGSAGLCSAGRSSGCYGSSALTSSGREGESESQLIPWLGASSGPWLGQDSDG